MIKNYSELLVLAVMHQQTSEVTIAKATNIGNIKRWKQQMLGELALAGRIGSSRENWLSLL